MKKVAYFIGLKLVEAAGVGGGYYLLCRVYVAIAGETSTPFLLGGLAVIAIAFAIVIALYTLVMGVTPIIRANWRLAEKLSNREESK